jgi:hypothetical protein
MNSFGKRSFGIGSGTPTFGFPSDGISSSFSMTAPTVSDDAVVSPALTQPEGSVVAIDGDRKDDGVVSVPLVMRPKAGRGPSDMSRSMEAESGASTQVERDVAPSRGLDHAVAPVDDRGTAVPEAVVATQTCSCIKLDDVREVMSDVLRLGLDPLGSRMLRLSSEQDGLSRSIRAACESMRSSLSEPCKNCVRLEREVEDGRKLVERSRREQQRLEVELVNLRSAYVMN